MNPENYITIYGWMISELKLSGNELLAYALIYSFSQSGKDFSGKLSYIEEWLGCSHSSAKRAIKSLTDKGLLSKKSITVNHITKCRYRTVKTGVKMNPGRGQNEPATGVKMNPNNNIYIHSYKKSSAEKYNSFMSNEYDFERLEEELLS